MTALPIAYMCYKVGTLFLGGALTYNQFVQLANQDWWHALRKVFIEIGWPFLVGSLLVATVVAVFTYPFMRWMLRAVGHPDGPTQAADNSQGIHKSRRRTLGDPRFRPLDSPSTLLIRGAVAFGSPQPIDMSDIRYDCLCAGIIVADHLCDPFHGCRTPANWPSRPGWN